MIELGRIERAGIALHAPFPHDDSIGSQAPEHASVCFVLLISDNDFVAGLKRLAERLRQDVGVLRS